MSSPAQQFGSISFSVLSLYGPTLISVHDCWKALTIWTFAGKVISLPFFFLGRIHFNGVISFNSIYTNIIISTCNQYKIIEVRASFFEGL